MAPNIKAIPYKKNAVANDPNRKYFRDDSALSAARLELHFAATLGKDLRLEVLRADHEAVLVTTGLWQERSLGEARGVIGALDFLESPDHPVPERVAQPVPEPARERQLGGAPLAAVARRA